MTVDIEFYGLNISASISNDATFEQGKFIRDVSYSDVDEAGTKYQVSVAYRLVLK